jgi:hypothetical protein
MIRLLLRTSGVFAVTVFVCVGAHAEAPSDDPQAATVPLDQIIQGSSGSRALRDLEPEFFVYRDTPETIAKYSTPEGLKEIEKIQKRAAEHSLVYAIERAMLNMRPSADGTIGLGFAVRGSGRSALEGIHDVLVKGQEPQQRHSASKEVSIVFFSQPAQPYVRIHSVLRSGTRVEVRFILISHGHMSLTWNLALIPLGTLRPGDYHVEMVRMRELEEMSNELGFPRLEAGVENQIVCQNFRFSVTQEFTKEKDR